MLFVCADAPGLVLEEWGFVDERELDSFKGHKSIATCDHFGYRTLGQCPAGFMSPEAGFADSWSAPPQEL